MIIDMNFSPLMENIFGSQRLSREESAALMDCLLDGTVSEVRMAAILTALRVSPLTVDILMGALESVMRHALRHSFSEALRGERLVDCSGTGGGSSSTVNLSTMAAVVAAAAGARVAKFGGRGVTSRCGSADVLESLGVRFAHSRAEALDDLSRNGISFLYGPAFYPGLKHIQAVRKSLGFHTIFDVLFPIMNPVPLVGQLLGVYSTELQVVVAQCLAQLGRSRALVVCSEDGLDEISVSGSTRVIKVCDGIASAETWTPETFGIKRANLAALKGGAIEENKTAFLDVLEGRASESLLNPVCLNAAAVLWCAGKVDDVKSGFEMATEAVRSGAALHLLEKWKRVPA